MLDIENGRSCLYQWDVDQRLEVLSDEITEVHFVNAVTSPALVCEVYEEDGRRFANVPNILLQQSWPIQAYGCCGSRVRDVMTCKVIRRERPADYVYTETELKTFASLEERIKKLEENGTGGGVQTVSGKAPDDNGNVDLDASDVGAIPDTGGTVNGHLYLGDRTSTNARTIGIRKKIDDDRYLEGFARTIGDGFQIGASEYAKSPAGGYTSQPNTMTFEADKTSANKPILFSSADAKARTREGLELYSQAETDEAIAEAVANVEGSPGQPGKTAYQYAQDGGYTGTEAEFAAKLAQELPEPYTLPVATANRLGGVKVGKGLVMDGEALKAKPENKYEVIAEVAYKSGSGVAMITFDTMADGEPFALEAVRITGSIDDIDIVKQFVISYTAYSGTKDVAGNINSSTSEKGCVGAALFEVKRGMMTMEASLWSSASWVVGNSYWQPRAVYVNDGLITKITIKAANGSVFDGYAFKIEGVRG